MPEGMSLAGRVTPPDDPVASKPPPHLICSAGELFGFWFSEMPMPRGRESKHSYAPTSP